ncbi:hypothetical protein AX15_004858 [Amanita polypyramis BW_CC]|nr:hypothetical protein AX15_004858 [Amanita polypyramis BW_CC]
MAKPSLWQSLLGKPSQSYSFPPDRDYFSSKQDMLRIATDVEQVRLTQHIQSIDALQSGLPSPQPHPPRDNLVSSPDPTGGHTRREDGDDNDDEFESAAGTEYRISIMTEDEEPDDGNMSDSEDDVFYTPNTSPRVSMASSRSGGSGARLGRRSAGASRKSSRRSLKMTTNRPINGVTAGAVVNTEPSSSSHAKSGSTHLRAPTRAKTDVVSVPVPDKTQFHSYIKLNGTTGGYGTQNLGKGPTSTSTLSSLSPDGNSLLSQPMSNSAGASSPLHSAESRGVDLANSTGRPMSDSTRHEVYETADDDWEKDVCWFVPSSDQAPVKSFGSKRRSTSPSSTANGNASYTPPRKQNKLQKTMSKMNPSIMMNMTALLEEDEDLLTPGHANSLTYANGSHHPQSSVVLAQQGSSRTSSKLSPSHLSRDISIKSTSRVPSWTSTANTSTASSRSRDIDMNDIKNNNNRNLTLRHRRSRSHEDLRSFTRSDTRSRTVSVSELAPLPMPTGDLPSHGTPGFTSLVLPRAPPPLSLTSRTQAPKVEPRIDGKVDLTRSGIAQTTMATVEVVHGLGAKTKKGLFGVFGRGVSLSRRKTLSAREGSRARRSEDGAATMGNGKGLGAHQPLGFTSYREPPGHMPSSSVLVQVWAVGVDGIDARLVGLRLGSNVKTATYPSRSASGINGHSRKGSLRWKLVRNAAVSVDQDQQQPQVGYIPGRSFVGRVLECGWEVGDDVMKKGDWVVGLLDVRKAGALAEFIVADRRRVHRVPHPKMANMSLKALGKQPDRGSPNMRTPAWGLTLEELALLPLCGVPAFRAVRTFIYAFSSSATRDTDGFVTGSHRIMSTPDGLDFDGKIGRRRRALILRGHDGVGAMAVRLLIAKGWNVSIHVPCPYPAQSDETDVYMSTIKERARVWGCDEIIFDDGLEEDGDGGRGAAVRILERMWKDGDVIDAVLDTIGGKDIWEASERLLKSTSRLSTSSGNDSLRSLNRKNSKGHAQFTTLVGDSPSRVVPTAGDLFKAGVRSLRMGGKPSGKEEAFKNGPNSPGKSSGGSGGEKKVAYAWLSPAQDADWEGQNISESIGAVLRLALEGVAKPWVGPQDDDEQRVVSFERAPEVFIDDGPLSNGSTVVVKIVG